MHRALAAALFVPTIALGSVAGPGFAAGPELHDLTIMKECDEYTGATPSFCTITASNIAAIPVGTRIYYYGPDLGVADPVMTDSTAFIDGGPGNLATGYCIVDQRDMAHQAGMCAFNAGSGTLQGFNAIIRVSEDGEMKFHWDGSYWIAGK